MHDDRRWREKANELEIELSKARRELQVKGWQRIDTAPKDGTKVLVYVPPLERSSDGDCLEPAIMVVARWDEPGEYDRAGWLEADGESYARYEATHWMPLPKPPR